LDSAPFEEWLVVQREALHRQALDAFHDLAAYHEAQGAYEQAIVYGQRQLAMESWRESAHRQLMRTLALKGDRAVALAQYDTCCRALVQELGTEPEPETTALYERIRAGEELQAEEALPPHNLPVQLSPFVGREAELAEIQARLRDPACRLLTLVGPGGSGKTRLALQAAAGQLDSYAQGVFFVSLAPLSSVEGIVPTIAQAIGFSLYGEGDPQQQLLNYLQQKNVLLILDDYTHLLEGASIATEILKTAPAVQVLVTSRAGLHVQGEFRFAVEGMAYPEGDWGKDAANYGAVKLFLQSTQTMRPGFALAGEHLADVVRICRLVEGIPLGILLAAAWIEILTPGEIAAEIEQSLDFLESNLRDAPERQRSMRVVFDYSWKLLSERERAVMQALSVFRG
jgi:hypothetical protein